MNEEDLSLRVTAVNAAVGILSSGAFRNREPKESLELLQELYQFLKESEPEERVNIVSLTTVD
jgi:hypothetical protein